MNSAARRMPFVLLGVLTLGTGLGIGLGLSEAPVTYNRSIVSESSTSAAPPCLASELSAAPGEGGVGAGNIETEIDFTNIGGRTCRLDGYPELFGLALSGERRLAFTSSPMLNLRPANLAPGGKGMLLIWTTDACTALNQPNQQAMAVNAAANTYDGVVIALPSGSGTLVVNGVQFDTACSLAESRLGVSASPG